jgi:hypothetical protein
MGSSVLNIKTKEINAELNQNESHLSVSELDILRKAYEIILENSNHCLDISDFSHLVKREGGEFNPMI